MLRAGELAEARLAVEVRGLVLELGQRDELIGKLRVIGRDGLLLHGVVGEHVGSGIECGVVRHGAHPRSRARQ